MILTRKFVLRTFIRLMANLTSNRFSSDVRTLI